MLSFLAERLAAGGGFCDRPETRGGAADFSSGPEGSGPWDRASPSGEAGPDGPGPASEASFGSTLGRVKEREFTVSSIDSKTTVRPEMLGPTDGRNSSIVPQLSQYFLSTEFRKPQEPHTF
jgi:hypothetical protein